MTLQMISMMRIINRIFINISLIDDFGR